MRVAYLVSRFPTVTETFVLREFSAVAAEGVAVDLHSLFRTSDAIVQPDAEPWVERLQRPGPGEGALALGGWMLRRPLRTLGTVATVVAGHARRPGILVRALATVPLAAAHARRFQRARVDHVHAHFANYPALAAWIAHRLAGVPYSFTPHAHDLFVHQAMLARKAADAAFVVAISDYNRRFLLERAGPGIDVPIVRYGIDAGRFPFRVRPANGGAPPRIACVARLLEYKGHAVLLRALADAPPPLAGAQLELVGDGPLRAELEREAGALGLRDRVHFHGAVPQPVVADVLARADVFALPSVISPDGDREGIPNALIEAMAAGLPAVSTYHSGVPELIEDGRTGYLARPGDVDDLRAALVRALTEPDPASRAQAARAVVEAEFSSHRSARRLVELFGAVSAGGGSSGPSRG
ncbi:MAG TPA: glycosyltransferase [Solirubrobacteraceae bacterium]|nr:glycosyltransferase [Solirubrobacteraceae bacterium]